MIMIIVTIIITTTTIINIISITISIINIIICIITMNMSTRLQSNNKEKLGTFDIDVMMCWHRAKRRYEKVRDSNEDTNS